MGENICNTLIKKVLCKKEILHDVNNQLEKWAKNVDRYYTKEMRCLVNMC